MLWFSLVIGRNTSRQMATSSENLVASAQFLVALATSESQFRALLEVAVVICLHHCTLAVIHNNTLNFASKIIWIEVVTRLGLLHHCFKRRQQNVVRFAC